MDTGLKKFNSLFIKKAVAVLLCLLTVGLMTNQLASSFIKAENEGIDAYAFSDALTATQTDIYALQTFRQEYNEYLELLSRSVSLFGDGSEEAYKKRKEAIDSRQDSRYTNDKKSFINAVSANNMYFLAGMYQGAIEQVNVLYTDDILNNESLIVNEYDLECYIEDNGTPTGFTVSVIPETVKDRLKGISYDGVFCNDRILTVVSEYDYEDYSEVVKASYRPGYYAFRVNDAVLKELLYSNDNAESYFSDYNSFLQEYNILQNTIKKDYPSGRFYIRDFSGTAYTNLTDLSDSSSFEQIEKTFEKFGTYTYLSDDQMYLNNGTSYDVWFYDNMRDALNSYLYYNETEDLTVICETSPQITETTVVTAESETVITGTEVSGITVPEATVVHTTLLALEPTTAKNKNPAVEKIISDEGYICYVAVSFTEDNAECKFRQAEKNVSSAQNIIKDCLAVCIPGLVIIICAFIFLIIKSGKRDDSEKVYLLKGDGVYSEIRIIADTGLACLALFGAVALIGSALNYDHTAVLPVIDILVVLAFGFVGDLVLYIIRLKKNRALLKSFGTVKLVSAAIKTLSKAYHSLKHKLLYTKELDKNVFIRTAIVVLINAAVAGIAFILCAESDEVMSLTAVLLLFAFDIFILYRGLRFVGGVNKLFGCVREMHEGNTDIEIDKNLLPEYLYLPAENLQCLSEGIKAAVNEAVRQEKTKTELITNVSHDLKTPLTSIINYVDLLKKCNIKDESALSYLQVLSDKSNRLKVLIEDLVEASKASAGAIPVSFISVSLRELTGQLIGEFEESFEEKKLQLVYDIPDKDIVVKADSKLIYRVMENLFVNIRKYALENTRVYIRISEKGSKALITLKNISAAPLNITACELKERFVRGEQSRTTEGNGLGLSIAENLCILQNGSLDIEINGDLFVVTVEMEINK